MLCKEIYITVPDSDILVAKWKVLCITLFRLFHSLLLCYQSLCNLIRKAFSAIVFISFVHLAPLSCTAMMGVLDTAARTNHNEWQLLCDCGGCVVGSIMHVLMPVSAHVTWSYDCQFLVITWKAMRKVTSLINKKKKKEF